jgi:hypothetical protein
MNAQILKYKRREHANDQRRKYENGTVAGSAVRSAVYAADPAAAAAPPVAFVTFVACTAS